MKFTFPNFIEQTEQNDSNILYNNIKITLQTQLGEIWFNSTFGTEIRDHIKEGINTLVIVDIQQDIENILIKYFSNDIKLEYLDINQKAEKINISLTYTELRTGKRNTIETEEKFINNDLTLY